MKLNTLTGTAGNSIHAYSGRFPAVCKFEQFILGRTLSLIYNLVPRLTCILFEVLKRSKEHFSEEIYRHLAPVDIEDEMKQVGCPALFLSLI